MSAPKPAPDNAASSATFTDNLRRFFRPGTGVGEDPVPFTLATATCLVLTMLALIVGVVSLIWPDPSSPPIGAGLMMGYAFASLHIRRPRHRWWAFGAAAAVSCPIVVGSNIFLTPVLGRGWATLAGYVCAGWIGAHVYAAVTHAPATRGAGYPIRLTSAKRQSR